MRRFIFLMICMCIYTSNIKLSYTRLIKPGVPVRPGVKPGIPVIPTGPIEDNNDKGNIRHLEKHFTLMVEAKVDIFVPLEIVSDIDVEAVVYGDQMVDVPFQVEMNKEPEKQNYYKLKYSEKEIDIDNDGATDTFIYSPEYINTKYVTDNYVRIHGDKISKEGDYKKTVYITVEAGI